jgi:hypothetical protein
MFTQFSLCFTFLILSFYSFVSIYFLDPAQLIQSILSFSFNHCYVKLPYILSVHNPIVEPLQFFLVKFKRICCSFHWRIIHVFSRSFCSCIIIFMCSTKAIIVSPCLFYVFTSFYNRTVTVHFILNLLSILPCLDQMQQNEKIYFM